MKTKDIKTVDLIVLEWFDKTYGNSYFAAEITVNYNLKNQRTIKMPFQYGYGNHSEHQAFKTIKKELNCFKKYEKNDSFWKVYRTEKIVYRYIKKENCLKRELMNL